MKLRKLLKNISSCQVRSPRHGDKEIEILGLSNNSKLVAPHHLFIAKKGSSHDGAAYIPEAVEAGAVVIVTDIFDPRVSHITQILHPDPKSIEPLLAQEFYHHPSKEMTIVGITGTNGKTTSAYLVKHLLDSLQNRSGLIGTIEYLVGNATIMATRTTPDLLGNQRMLREMIHCGQRACAMEVTSHALVQGRVEAIFFDIALFTNLSSEHLDYHTSMENYAEAKSRLFTTLDRSVKKEAQAVVNIDSPWHRSVTGKASAPIVTFSSEKKADFSSENIQLSPQGSHFTLLHREKKYPAFVPLVGRHNLYNALGAISTMASLGYPIEAILAHLRTFTRVKGRLEPVANSLGLSIFVDFAHTDDAIYNVLQALSEFKEGRIITVFGAGGDRDRTKRAKMAEVVETLSDFAIVTTDNPRSENPEDIAKEIMAGFTHKSSHLFEIDREKAIYKAIEMAKPKDMILIAGKGHETYQIFHHKTIEFDDEKMAKKAAHSISENRKMAHV